MTRTLASDSLKQVEKSVTVMGWVNSRRDHGGLIFIDLRDESGLLQLTIHPEAANSFTTAESCRDEFVIKASGKIVERDKKLQNPNLDSGTVELVVEDLEILNRSEPLPFQIDGDQNIGEETRLKYRFLDLRRSKMQTMLKKRAAYYSRIRSYMESKDFTEISTPILANSSPEGARDFVIPSRVHPGKFYALPQAPQQFKQLLMVGGVPRYYQIATCFRDEDPRADRLYGDFYQLDLEMSFIEEGDQVHQAIEPLILDLAKSFAGKKLKTENVPRISYQDAMDRFGSDKPDLRYDMELTDLSEELKTCEFGVFSGAIKNGGVVKAICVSGGGTLSRKQIDGFTETAKQEGAGGLPYIMIADGEFKSPIAKFMSSEELEAIKQKIGAGEGDMIVFGADTRAVVNKVLGRLRTDFAKHFELADPNEIALAWIVDFPFYEWDESRNQLDFGHNPFSMPKGGSKALDTEDKLSIKADQYDMVMNGYEICSGAIRNHNPEIMYKAFANVGYSKEHVDENFGAMINAFKFGAPPHGGCAFGLDRMFMVLVGEENIREVVAFPKNGSGVDVMMNSPIAIEDKQLSELSLEIKSDD